MRAILKHAVQFLLAHVVPEPLPASAFVDGDTYATLAQLFSDVTLTVEISGDGAIAVAAPDDGSVSTVTTADVAAGDSFVHIVDAPVVPGRGGGGQSPPPGISTVVDAIASDPELSTFYELILTSGLDGVLRSNEFTVLAPTNGAFDALDPALLASYRMDGNMVCASLPSTHPNMSSERSAAPSRYKCMIHGWIASRAALPAGSALCQSVTIRPSSALAHAKRLMLLQFRLDRLVGAQYFQPPTKAADFVDGEMYGSLTASVDASVVSFTPPAAYNGATATVVEADIMQDLSVLHKVDGVLNPEGVSLDPNSPPPPLMLP